MIVKLQENGEFVEEFGGPGSGRHKEGGKNPLLTSEHINALKGAIVTPSNKEPSLAEKLIQKSNDREAKEKAAQKAEDDKQAQWREDNKAAIERAKQPQPWLSYIKTSKSGNIRTSKANTGNR